jgi:hypothetical protein
MFQPRIEMSEELSNVGVETEIAKSYSIGNSASAFGIDEFGEYPISMKVEIRTDVAFGEENIESLENEAVGRLLTVWRKANGRTINPEEWDLPGAVGWAKRDMKRTRASRYRISGE